MVQVGLTERPPPQGLETQGGGTLQDENTQAWIQGQPHSGGGVH